MFRHYFTSALNSYRRAPFTTCVNVLALALGLACFIFAYALTRYYEAGDRGFANADRIHVLTQRLASSEFESGAIPATSIPAAEHLRVDFPQIEKVARATARAFNDMPVSSGTHKGFFQVTGVDPEFLEIFDLPFSAGDPKQALGEPHSLVLSEAAAEKLFGTREILGRRILINGLVEGTVRGVIGAIPQPSHMGYSNVALFRPELFASWDMIEELLRASTPTGFDVNKNWTSGFVVTYMLFPENGSFTPAQLAAQLPAFAKRHVPAEQTQDIKVEFGVIPISGVTLQLLEAVFLRNSAPLATLLLSLGGLVLLVACFNYANLATAQATGQAKTVGLRRALGAQRRQIASQYLFESALLGITALAFALGALALVFAVLRTSTGMNLGLSLFAGFEFCLFLVGLLLLVTLVAGSYPALILSRVRPVLALSTGRSRAGPRFVPTLLVGVQFAAASLLLIAILVMSAQNNSVRKAALEAGTDPIVAITTRLDAAKLNSTTLRNALASDPHVKSVTTLDRPPWQAGVSNVWTVTTSSSEGASKRALLGSFVGSRFFDTMEMKLLAGRLFDSARGDDETTSFFSNENPGRVANMIIDRSAATQLAFASPQAAVDQMVYFRLGGPPRAVRIIGVVEDRTLSLMGLGATANGYIHTSATTDSPFALIRISRGDIPAALARIDALWNELSPGVPIKRRFVDELFNESYELLQRIHGIFSGLAFFAFLIAIMGLFGMAIHVAGKRRHEIGVRKTLGGSTRQIFMLLLRDFSKPVLVANLIAWPLGFAAMQVYLGFFTNRIDLTLVPFVVSLVVTLLIAWLAVSGQAWRAARVQPARTLRYE